MKAVKVRLSIVVKLITACACFGSTHRTGFAHKLKLAIEFLCPEEHLEESCHDSRMASRWTVLV